MIARAARLVAGLAALALAGCNNAPTIFVLVQIDPSLPSIDQLAFRVEKTGAATLGPTMRPDPAGGALALEQSVRLQLPETYAGTITVRVEGRAAGVVVGSGTGDALARLGSETTVVVKVEQGLVCDAAVCADGCCASGLCVRGSTNLCGSGGGACSSCDLVVSDRCETGVCKCGSSAQCLPGQTCVNGGCRCDPVTCPSGCCTGNTCVPGNTDTQCGTAGGNCSACTPTPGCAGGVCPDCAASCDGGCCSGNTCNAPGMQTCGPDGKACKVCDPVLTDRCAGGVCSCGVNPACVNGQRCVSGNCVCNSSSCPQGCCQGNQCQSKSIAACGSDGGTCTACNTLRADTCSSAGRCSCGTGNACTAPAICTGGACLCDGGPCCNASTCPNGCCNGGQCLTSGMPSCGIGGVACVNCNLYGSSCSNGVCKCKNIAYCQPGQKCNTGGMGSCICDTTSGCNGCCVSNTCQSNTFSQCGANGANCFSCNAGNSDTCLSGTCRCGNTGMTCAGGTYCDAGACVM